ncbi:hypothetical protein [Neorhodopirellula pilleata]|uniref:Hemerythrin-like domain-containing protein n=1 Tax=Neorhodopirellula pilleata TaxID=2714738 RepID=A0A5C6APL2_9BACT|nr:hypothetical protein [Neorhodopirellula pilleata]TWU01458.1 hypothetical protein Pla100_11920 [Neorhodopirellula pilleata]
MATVAPIASSTNRATSAQNGSSSGSPQTVWLVNAAFLQEIKDSNPHLWHEFHRLRTLSQLEQPDCETPQQAIKGLAQCLDGIRDLLALQFTLEESYGLIATPLTPSPYGQPSPEAMRRQEVIDERQMMVRHVIDQHRCLYLQIVDLVEQAEELQYRGCDSNCLRLFAEKVERFSCDFTAHERLEGELIRLHGSHSTLPASADHS